MRTKNGYQMFELLSALQKEIRRGKEEEAMYWALELIEGGFWAHCFNRLLVIAHEDIGLGDQQAFLVATSAIRQAREWYEQDKKHYILALANAILIMCRARKSREADNFQAVIRGKRMSGLKLEIPDYALDGHTYRGKGLGRGLEYFLDEGTRLENPAPDKYQDVARRFWPVIQGTTAPIVRRKGKRSESEVMQEKII